MSHTPGPWKWNQKNKCWHSLDGKPVAYESKWPCGLVFLDVSDETLAFSAPDLLAALEAVVMVADRNTVEFDMARAAIAKAKGKA